MLLAFIIISVIYANSCDSTSSKMDSESCYTIWFDRDDPSGEGDFETVTHIKKDYPGELCDKPIYCEVQTTHGTPAELTGDNIELCTVFEGFSCENKQQEGKHCQDYKIRFKCPKGFCNVDSDSSDTSNTSDVCYTEWFDCDNPSGDGDYETVVDIREEYPHQLCKNPISCEVETIKGIPAENTGDIIEVCSTNKGFICENKYQKGKECKDYKIRFKCPQDFCQTDSEPCYTQWFDRDDPSGNGDHETTPEIKDEYPDKICKDPISCEVQTTDGTPVELTSNNIDLCTVIDGFICENEQQNGGNCKDYKIRYECPDDFCKKDTQIPSDICYTQWFDRDTPSGKGDFETTPEILQEYPDQMCKNPIACEVETNESTPSDLTSNDVELCTVLKGFFCINAQQHGRQCKNYKIRFECPEDFCNTNSEPCYTQWFDRDNPSGSGDYETTPEIQQENPEQMCTNPISCEVQTTLGTPVDLTTDNTKLCTVLNGFSCINKHQNGEQCEDYKIRYECPEDFCKDNSELCYTQWFDRDNPSGSGDYETVTELRREYPDQLCTNPISCEVQTIHGTPAELTADNIKMCSVLGGFFCMNKRQKGKQCQDYKIRFKCPEDFCKADSEPCYTQWFNRDRPSGDGDYETVSEIKQEYPNQMCDNPTLCEVQTVHGTPAELTSDNIKLCTVIEGFICENKHQQGKDCKDYKIRFKCPEDFCNVDSDVCYTQWFEHDDTSRSGQYETITDLRKEYPDQLCDEPISCEVQTTEGTPVAIEGDTIKLGVSCPSGHHNKRQCNNYKIRFKCPKDFCNGDKNMKTKTK